MDDINNINDRINSEFCYETFKILNDDNLLDIYRNQKSTKNKILKFRKILEDNCLCQNVIDNIIKEYITGLIPTGTKSTIRGITFNNIVKNKILSNEFLKNDRFVVSFEVKVDGISELADWYIYDKISKKSLVGMNQIDLWSGGHQINRAYKYLFTENKNFKLICVICNCVFIKSKNKTYKIFETGFKNNSLCYLTTLNGNINEYFS